MNAPERMDAWRVPNGEPKIAATQDEKVRRSSATLSSQWVLPPPPLPLTLPRTQVGNAYNYRIKCEDHTMGNLLRTCV